MLKRNRTFKEKLLWLGVYFIFLIFRIWSMTWRIKRFEPPLLKERLQNNQRCVFGLFHGHDLSCLHLLQFYKAAPIVSLSRDGSLVSDFINMFGVPTARGSSSKGGLEALNDLVEFAKNGDHNPAFTVDGPRGPLYSVKHGIFEAARRLQVPVFGLAVKAEKKILFKKTWSQHFIPYPFSKVEYHWIGPIYVSQDQSSKDPALTESFRSQMLSVLDIKP